MILVHIVAIPFILLCFIVGIGWIMEARYNKKDGDEFWLIDLALSILFLGLAVVASLYYVAFISYF